jgi:tetratricopeptide (TPR) repeat protein
LNSVSNALKTCNIVCLFGPAGIGKTVAAAQFAEREGATYLRLAGLPPKDIFAVCADSLKFPGTASGTFATLAGSRLGFSAAWAERKSVTLVLDECDYVRDVLAAIDAGGGTSSSKRVLFTARACPENVCGIEVPRLTAHQVRALLSQSNSSEISDEALGGSPLKVQEYFADAELRSADHITHSREILAYLALSPIPLSADQLLTLLGDDQLTIEGLYDTFRHLGRSLDDSPRGFRLLHSETAAGIKQELKRTSQRLRFYTNRLLVLFDGVGDARLAYETAIQLEDGGEMKYATGAIRQSAELGDWRMGTAIAERLLDSALDEERRGEAFYLMLQLVYPMELMGQADRASELLEKARGYVPKMGPQAKASFEETQLTSQARRTLARGDIQKLEDLYTRHYEAGNAWDAARLGLELSALYMAAKNYERAVGLLRPTLATFAEEEDYYGFDLAERNLASALSGIPGNTEEVDRLIDNISKRATTSFDSRRQRAWICNILTRRYREASRFADAKMAAMEAIEISEALGDASLRAITYINLGNIATDEEDVPAALAAYSEAANAARRCDRRDIEADASRLRARILNDVDSSADVVPDRHGQAVEFARHA